MSLNKLLSIIILLSIIGCATNPSLTYNNLSSAYKAKAVAVNFNNQVTGGWGVSGGYSQSDANLKAINACKNYNPQHECIIEMEGSNYVLIENILEKNDWRANNLNNQNIQRNSVNWSALSELGANLTNQANNNTYKRLEPVKRTYLFVRSYQSGMNTVCVYDGWTETMNGLAMCPLSITK